MKIPDYNKKIKHPTYLELQEEIKRLKEEYVMLQNASDEVEEKDKEIETLKADIYEAWDNSTWWRNRYNAIVKQNDDNHKKLVKEQEKIEKAIEYMNNTFNISSVKEMYEAMNELEEILQGSDKE